MYLETNKHTGERNIYTTLAEVEARVREKLTEKDEAVDGILTAIESGEHLEFMHVWWRKITDSVMIDTIEKGMLRYAERLG